MADCVPAWSRGGCRPILEVEDQGNCEGPAGTPVVGAPQFEVVVDNGPDLIWKDEDYVVIESDDDGTPYWFDNI